MRESVAAKRASIPFKISSTKVLALMLSVQKSDSKVFSSISATYFGFACRVWKLVRGLPEQRGGRKGGVEEEKRELEEERRKEGAGRRKEGLRRR